MKKSGIQALKVCGCNPNYRDAKFIVPAKQEVKSLRWWQVEAFEKLKDKPLNLTVAFCGSGKSVLQVALAIYEIEVSGWTQKQLIIVPQQHISGGFIGDENRDYITLELNGKVYDWRVEHNFCGDINSVLNALRNWLLADAEELGRQFKGGTLVTGLTAVASHHALGLVWNTFTDAEKAKAAHKLTLRADEAHHISGVYDVLDSDYSPAEMIAIEEERTNLGDVCAFLMNSKDKTIGISLATATPYRGDKGIILDKKASKRFTTYYLDWLEHFNTLGIENFDLEYEEYKDNPIKSVVAKIKSEPKEKHMVVIPSSGTKWRKEGTKELHDLLNALYKVVPKERVLDLVTPSTQDFNKRRLLREPKNANGGKSMFDVVVTCMLGREGTDWCPCSRLHNTSCESSVTLAVQTLGRPFRRFEGKTKVCIRHYVPQFVVPKKGMTKRELLTDRTNALLVCMQLDEMMHPIMIPAIKEKRNASSGSGSKHASRISLAEVFGCRYQEFKSQLIEEIECLREKDTEQLDMVIDDLLYSYKVDDEDGYVKDGVRAIVLRILSSQLKNEGVDVDFIRKEGFDRIVEKHIDKDTSIFFGSYNKKDWATIRSILRRTFDEQLQFLVENSNGKYRFPEG